MLAELKYSAKVEKYEKKISKGDHLILKNRINIILLFC